MIQCTVCMQGAQRGIDSKTWGLAPWRQSTCSVQVLLLAGAITLYGRGRLGMSFLGDPMR